MNTSPTLQPTDPPFLVVYDFQAMLMELYAVDAEFLLTMLRSAQAARVNVDVFIAMLETMTGARQ